MRKRWGIRVIAILMLIAGLLLFLLGILPAILAAVRGTAMGLGVWMAIPSALGGCAGALFLLVAGSVLLTLGRIADNFAVVSQPAPYRNATPGVAVIAVTPQVASDSRRSQAAVVATTAVAKPEAEAGPSPVVEAPVAAAVIAGAAVVPEAEVVPTSVAESPVVETAIAGAVTAERPLDVETEIAPAVVVTDETIAHGPAEELAVKEEATLAAATMSKVPAAEVAAEISEPLAPAILSRQEEVSALQAQLAALQAQLDELGEAPVETEELPAVVEDEGPAPGATAELKLPGADEAAHVAAEMAALETEPEAS